MSLHPFLIRLRQSAEYERCLAALRNDRAPVWIEGLASVSKAYLAGGAA